MPREPDVPVRAQLRPQIWPVAPQPPLQGDVAFAQLSASPLGPHCTGAASRGSSPSYALQPRAGGPAECVWETRPSCLWVSPSLAWTRAGWEGHSSNTCPDQPEFSPSCPSFNWATGCFAFTSFQDHPQEAPWDSRLWRGPPCHPLFSCPIRHRIPFTVTLSWRLPPC